MHREFDAVTARATNIGRWATPVILVALALVVIIPPSTASLSVAVVCGSALLVTVIVSVFGLRRSGGGFLILGIGTVGFNDLHPVGALGWMEVSDPFFVTGVVLLLPGLATSALRLPPAYLAGAFGFVTIGTLSALVSEQPGPNFGYLLDVVQGVVVLPVLLVWWRPEVRAVSAAGLAYMVGGSVNVVAAVLEGADEADRYGGLSTHPNILGYCQVLSLALVPFLLETVPRKFHWIIGVMSVISVYGIWISGSRAALIGALVLTLLFPLFKRSIPAALAVAGLYLPALAVVDRVAQDLDPSTALGRLLGDASATASNVERAAGAQVGMDQFRAHPLLGDGWLTIWGAHNGYLQVAAAIGVFGFVAYLVLLSSILRPLIAVPRPYGLLAVPGLAAVMLDLVLPVLGARYVWCVVGLALCAYRLAPTEGTSSSSIPPARPRRLSGAVGSPLAAESIDSDSQDSRR